MLLRLAPSVAEDKDVISCYSQHNEDRQLNQRVIERYLEDSAIECISDWEGQYNHEHGHKSHEDARKVIPDETEDEHQAENGKRDIFHEQLLKVDTNEEPSKDLDLYGFELLVTALSPVSHVFLEICHNFCLI